MSGQGSDIPLARIPDAVPARLMPAEAMPRDSVPRDSVPGDSVPRDSVPGEVMPAEIVSGEAVPGEAHMGPTAMGQPRRRVARDMARNVAQGAARLVNPPPDRGMDGLNLMLAGMGAAYGAFIPVYLTGQAWTQTRIGMVLTVSTVVSMLCQVPAGLLIDALARHRRALLAVAIVATGVVPLVFAVAPFNLPVLVAMTVQAIAGSLLSPGVSAVSLGIAGREGLGVRFGRNARYGSIGAGRGAAIMGISGYFGSQRQPFVIGALLTVPALLAWRAIGPDQGPVNARQPGAGLKSSRPEADPRSSRPEAEPDAAAEPEPATRWGKIRAGLLSPFALLRDRGLLVFALCVALFQVASIAVLQLAAVDVTARLGSRGPLVIAAFLIIPQVVVALISPAIGRATTRFGSRAVLLAGFATVPVRGAFFAAVKNPYVLVPVQVLEGLGGATLGVMMPLVAADLTRRSGHYTTCLSLLGLAGGAGTAISTALAGWTADRYGHAAAFWVLTAAGVAAVALVLLAMPETRKAGEGDKGSGA